MTYCKSFLYLERRQGRRSISPRTPFKCIERSLSKRALVIVLSSMINLIVMFGRMSTSSKPCWEDWRSTRHREWTTKMSSTSHTTHETIPNTENKNCPHSIKHITKMILYRYLESCILRSTDLVKWLTNCMLPLLLPPLVLLRPSKSRLSFHFR